MRSFFVGPTTKSIFPATRIEESDHGGLSALLFDDESPRDKLLSALATFGEEHGRTDEDGLVWPSDSSITIAYRLIDTFSDDPAVPLPEYTVPNGDGGILFEWNRGPSAIHIEIDEHGSMELVTYQDGMTVLAETF